MKAISIKQPWATMILMGYKTIELRSWQTKHRGEILIHASKTPDMKAFDYYSMSIPFDVPRGVIIGSVIIEKMKKYTHYQQLNLDEDLHKCSWADLYRNVRRGVFGWCLSNPKHFSSYLPWRGMPGLFEVNICFECNGIGSICQNSFPCHYCNGTGRI